ncbi:hypothetical protein MANY_42920 [Mycolicibacterium anyangense]|uniref:Uncharacterized protein n=1 Tax=Mycolicibacterium anyangense TaxID=1431246 RepID=A0A6N4WDT4_9MYCO|nr:hypothetical protein MANY_42920 [Mycolicibacterium anyangense]
MTVTGANPAGADALGAGGAGGAQPQLSATARAAAQRRLARQAGMHLPHEDLGGSRGGDALAAR